VFIFENFMFAVRCEGQPCGSRWAGRRFAVERPHEY
jgi:hypothetical protein